MISVNRHHCGQVRSDISTASLAGTSALHCPDLSCPILACLAASHQYGGGREHACAQLARCPAQQHALRDACTTAGLLQGACQCNHLWQHRGTDATCSPTSSAQRRPSHSLQPVVLPTYTIQLPHSGRSQTSSTVDERHLGIKGGGGSLVVGQQSVHEPQRSLHSCPPSPHHPGLLPIALPH